MTEHFLPAVVFFLYAFSPCLLYAQPSGRTLAVEITAFAEGHQERNSESIPIPGNEDFDPATVRPQQFFSIGTRAATRFTDEFGLRYGGKFGLRIFKETGNYHGFSAFGGGATWDVGSIRTDTISPTSLRFVRVPNGEGNQVFGGVSYTYGWCLTKKLTGSRFYLGFRGEYFFSKTDYTSEILSFPFPFPDNTRTSSVSTALVPEWTLFPKEKLYFTVSAGLPIMSFAAVSNKNLGTNRRGSGFDFDAFRFKTSRLEITAGFLL